MNIFKQYIPLKFRARFATFLAAALGLFLGLRWNEFFKNLLDKYLPVNGNLVERLLILLGITIAIVAVSIWFEKKLR